MERQQQFIQANQPLTKKHAVTGFIAGLVIGVIPAMLLYYGNILFVGTGGPGINPDPTYGSKSFLSIALLLSGSLYYILALSLMLAVLLITTLRKLRPMGYGLAISLAFSLNFAQILIGSRAWYGLILLSIAPLVFIGDHILQWRGQRE